MPPHEITDQEYVQKVKDVGQTCPYCGSDNVDCDDDEFNHEVAHQNLFCTDCEKRWQNVYHLVGFLNIIDE